MSLKERVLALFEEKVKPNGDPYGCWAHLQLWALERVLDAWSMETGPVPMIQLPDFHGASTLLCGLMVALIKAEPGTSVILYSYNERESRNRNDSVRDLITKSELTSRNNELLELEDGSRLHFRPALAARPPFAKYVLLDAYDKVPVQFLFNGLVPVLQMTDCRVCLFGDPNRPQANVERWTDTVSQLSQLKTAEGRVFSFFSIFNWCEYIQRQNATKAAACLIFCLRLKGFYKDIQSLLGRTVLDSWPDPSWEYQLLQERLEKKRKRK